MKSGLSKETLKTAYRLMCEAKAMTDAYEKNMKIVGKYVHATSRGHEAIQLATSMQLLPQDFLYPYYRDDSMLLGIGMKPYQLMLQLLAKKDDVFSAGRTYYSHPSLRDEDKPKIPHQSSATGMQAIPATGAGLGLLYKEKIGIAESIENKPIVVCSLGDASVTEGEVAEAFQMAALKQIPILYVVQDNGWDISANTEETMAQNAFEYSAGFHGLEARTIEGNDFVSCYSEIKDAINIIRTERRPILIHARVPLLNHHTSGVRMEWYRDDLEEHKSRDPLPILRQSLLNENFTEDEISSIEQAAAISIEDQLAKALEAEDPKPEDLYSNQYAETSVKEESGERRPKDGEATVMVDSALHGIEEIMQSDKNSLLYGQDVGRRLGGVFREAATLAEKFGDERVFNTPIQEAFIVGSTAGMSAVGLKPIVEVQFADYIYPSLNQLFSEVSRSCYLSNGKWPVSMILRVPIGAYGSGGPYHSSSVESILSNIRGIKLVYPSNGADMKGLLKAAYLDPNPVVMLEHKGLYWSKVKGTEMARSIEPSADYILPLGKANVVLSATESHVTSGKAMTIVTYGMSTHWAWKASSQFQGRLDIIDLRTLNPLDTETVYASVNKTNRCLVVTEEIADNSFAQSLAARIQENCFRQLDCPVQTIGSENVPAIPLNSTLEQTYLLNADKVESAIQRLFNYWND